MAGVVDLGKVCPGGLMDRLEFRVGRLIRKSLHTWGCKVLRASPLYLFVEGAPTGACFLQESMLQKTHPRHAICPVLLYYHLATPLLPVESSFLQNVS